MTDENRSELIKRSLYYESTILAALQTLQNKINDSKLKSRLDATVTNRNLIMAPLSSSFWTLHKYF